MRTSDFPFLVQLVCRNILLRNILGFRRRDMHGNVLHELLEFITARNEVGFTIDLHEDPDFAAHMDVLADDAFSRDAAFAFLGGCQAALA